MKAHTNSFKENIWKFGREIDSKITYELNGETIELGSEELNSVTPHYEGAILKSVMKQLDIDSNAEIPLGTILAYEFGLKVGNGYEYINYGNYVVYSVEKKEDTASYQITCYDKMLYAMKDYENSGITFPITIRNYISAICNKIGLTFANSNDTFVNYNKEIPNELYLDENGRSLGYTFRDVLDELAEVTASTICINEDDELEIRYIKDVGELTNAIGGNLTLETNDSVKLENFELEGKTTQETRSGKNKYNINNNVKNNTSVEMSINDNILTLTATGTTGGQYARCNISNLDSSKSYTLSLKGKKIVSGTDGQPYIRLTIQGSNDGSTYNYINSKTITNPTINIEYSLETTVSGYSIYRVLLYNNTFNPVSVGEKTQYYNIQFEEGTTATEYEQYGAMPSPDYPSELVSVGYENIFNKNGTINGQQTTTILDTGVRITQPTSGTYKYNYISLGGSELLGKTITISSNIVSSASNKGQLSLYYANSSNPAISLVGNLATTGSATFTIANSFPSNASRVNLLIYSNTNGVGNANDYTDFTNLIITKGTQAHSYIPYGKYGIEIKTQGKNLFDKNTITLGGNWNGAIGTTCYPFGSATTRATILVPVKSNTNYYLSLKQSEWYIMQIMLSNKNYVVTENISSTVTNNTNRLITTSSDTTFIGIKFKYGSAGTTAMTSDLLKSLFLQIEEANNQTEFEEYKSKTYLYTLNQPLRSIGDTKDLLYIKNGMLYVKRSIGSILLNGSEVGWSNQGGQAPYSLIVDNLKRINSQVMVKSSNFMGVSYSSSWTIYNALVSTSTASSSLKLIKFKYVDMATLDDFKSWLSTHNTEVQYVLDEPYTEELGQVDMPSTYEGITHIDTTDELEPNMNITYVSEIDTIDEEYLKDVNVNFGEKFGPVNTIVLSRGGDGDKIAQSMPTNLPDEDKIAIQITDNQIMNDNNRADFIPAILNELYGLEYYINDFTSTGVCYYDLCDKYNVSIDENTYPCIMFNDEIDITQGLVEHIYTDMQEENETEYKYTRSDDRGITQANIIAKKNEASIVELTSKYDSVNGRLNTVETKQTDTERTIDIISKNIDANGNVTEVTTTTGFTFNAEGMAIKKDDFEILQTPIGAFYKEGNNIVGQYTKDGSKQKDLELFGVYYYGMNNIDDTPMFVAQLYTDNNGVECFGHFYNRGDN